MLTNTCLSQDKAEEHPEEPVKSPEPESEESDLGGENSDLITFYQCVNYSENPVSVDEA